MTHYLIHAYDFAPLAEKGVASARRYAGIAPAVPHARHMPSHIYSMVGLWEESIASNASALEIQPDYYHASDFTVYAHLQLAQDAKADAMIKKSLATADRGDRPINFVNFTAKAAMPARYVLERADWTGAASLPIIPTKYPMADSLIRFTRGLGMMDAVYHYLDLTPLDRHEEGLPYPMDWLRLRDAYNPASGAATGCQS